jgi:hypothetical protein
LRAARPYSVAPVYVLSVNSFYLEGAGGSRHLLSLK